MLCERKTLNKRKKEFYPLPIMKCLSVGQVRVCHVWYVLDRVNRRDRFSMKKPLRSSARGASFHTKHASNANVGRVVLLDANSYLALC
jgi:hypothetical protein